jgi:hypothetical protein
MDEQICPNCGTTNEHPSSEAQVAGATIRCTKCGVELPPAPADEGAAIVLPPVPPPIH